MHRNKTIITNQFNIFIQLGVAIVILWLMSFYSYLLFHTVAEFIAATVAIGVFFVAWNTRHYLTDGYFVIIGMSYLFVGIMTILHALAYKGMNIFMPFNDPNLATQLWLLIRYMTAAAFFMAPFFAGKKIKANIVLFVFLIFFGLLILAVFPWDIFPTAYQNGAGLTPFKKISEYILSLIFLGSLVTLYYKREKFDKSILRLLIASTVLSVITEFIFTLYISVYDYFNLVGHLLLVSSSFLVYLAIIEISLTKPYQILSRSFEAERDALYKTTKDLENAANNLKKFRLALEAASDHIVITDIEGEIIFANAAAEILTGYSREEMIGNTPLLWGKGLVKEYDRGDNFYKEIVGRLKDDNFCFFSEIINTRKNGETYVTDVRISPIHDEKGVATFFIFIERDITKLKEIDKVKSEFISMASHQLRTPLASISLSSELLLRGVSGSINQSEKAFAEEIFSSAQKMSQLISDLLSITKIELGTSSIRPEKINFISLVDKILDEIKLQTAEKGLTVVKDYQSEALEINGTRNILTTIIENLIVNAMQYTPAGGYIKVTIKNNDHDVLISITDSGCGIPAEEQSKIFNKFFRTTSAKNMNSNGSGLGLYIVKTYIEKIGARIWFESQESKGTTFHVLLPHVS